MITVYLEVINDKTLVKKPLCKVPEYLYEEFMEGAKATFHAYVCVWAKSDFALHNSLSTVQDIDKLLDVVEAAFKKSYPELYVVDDIKPKRSFWVTYWLSSRMKFEVEKRKLYDNRR